MSANTGGPAFPSIDAELVGISSDGEERFETKAHGGMTLRAYIATEAMQAMITKSSGQDSTGGAAGVPLIAKYAVEYADALIAALEAP